MMYLDPIYSRKTQPKGATRAKAPQKRNPSVIRASDVPVDAAISKASPILQSVETVPDIGK